ncbi:uncharacterized protein BT62DRAFT_1005107 [Guyanagaster necrorhizus]|uniref:Uncharacterized protein n=1 Tax=Guyanagaster necrorhizus TaxID=856835 RepID=A0A9P8ASV7_9AGAR|nr:uncharacterized protein BT62DRAFT_1005107 [Guyanagaster necrorhizus MCA 3950]KAG7446749.1 hypothetical protein BT62DRAFT_1005107 [Guyanagaster necrorhizus MCA 3950]
MLHQQPQHLILAFTLLFVDLVTYSTYAAFLRKHSANQNQNTKHENPAEHFRYILDAPRCGFFLASTSTTVTLTLALRGFSRRSPQVLLEMGDLSSV